MLVDQVEVVVQGGLPGAAGEDRPAGVAQQLAAAAPEVEAKVVDGVVAIRLAGDDAAIEIVVRPGEEAGEIEELAPGRGRGERATVLALEVELLARVLEEVGPVHEDLRPVVVGETPGTAVIVLLEAEDGRGPAGRPIGRRVGST